MEISELLAKAEPVLTLASRAKDNSEGFSDSIGQAMDAVRGTLQKLEVALADRSEAVESIKQLECAMKIFDEPECRAVLTAPTDHCTINPEPMEVSMLRCYYDSCLDDLKTVKQRYRQGMQRVSDDILGRLRSLEALLGKVS